jgi:hypothetical protein
MTNQFLTIKGVLPKLGLEVGYNNKENKELYTKNSSNKNS